MYVCLCGCGKEVSHFTLCANNPLLLFILFLSQILHNPHAVMKYSITTGSTVKKTTVIISKLFTMFKEKVILMGWIWKKHNLVKGLVLEKNTSKYQLGVLIWTICFIKFFFLSRFKATGEVMFTDLMSPYISVCFSVPAALSLAHGILIVNPFLQKIYSSYI